MTDTLRIYRQWFVFLALFLLTRAFFSDYLPLTDFSEARYAEIARKILAYHDWITLWFKPDVPFWGKPPLAFWSMAVSFLVMGANEFAARLPALVYTLLTAAVIFAWARKHWSDAVSLAAVVIYLGTFLVIQTAGAAITDPLLVLTTTIVMVCFFEAMKTGRRLPAYLMWAALGVGLLAKGPLAPVLCGLTCGVWVMLTRNWLPLWTNIRWFTGLASMFAIAVPWYYLSEQKTPGFLDYFIVGEHFQRYITTEWPGDMYGSVKNQPFAMIWVYYLVGTMPFSALALFRLCFRNNRSLLADVHRATPAMSSYLMCWAVIPILFFTPARNVLITYIMPAIPAFAIFLATRLEILLLPRKFLIPMASIGVAVFWCGFMVVYKLSYEDHHYNQRPIIEAYEKLNERDPGPLIYSGAYRFSAVFYTQDQVVFSARPTSYFTDDTFYHAVRDMWKGSFDGLNNRCREVHSSNDFSLWYCPAVNVISTGAR